MISMKKFVGILIAFLGGILGLTAVLGFSIDRTLLLSAIQAPIFETSLQILLDSHRAIFTFVSFGTIFFIIICTMIAFGRHTAHIGFTIMMVAMLAGISAWPHGTPFMLIVIFGAHWIAVSEIELLAAKKRKRHADAQDSTPRHADAQGRKLRRTEAQDRKSHSGDSQTHTDAPDSHTDHSPDSSLSKRDKGLRKFLRRFFH